MNQDIVCLLQDLGRDLAVDVIANYILINPDTEDLIAAKMGSLISLPGGGDQQASTSESNANTSQPSGLSSIIPLAMSFANLGEFKMIFVVNQELQMGKGKQCAQVAHAALGLYQRLVDSSNQTITRKLNSWLSEGQKKIVVKGNNYAHLKTLQNQAKEANVPTFLVSDAGCTQIAPGSKTVLALFGHNEELDKITGSLKLL